MKIRWLVIVFFAFWPLKWMWNYLTDDYSVSSGYEFFSVPVTENLSLSLSECRPYRRDYQHDLFQQLWTNTLGNHYVFKIHGIKNGSCLIRTITPWENKQYKIPLGLAKHIGELLRYSIYEPQKADPLIRDFNHCSGYVSWDIYSPDDSNFFNVAFKEMEEYIEQWDDDNMAELKALPAKHYQADEEACRANLATLARVIKQTPDFCDLSRERMDALIDPELVMPQDMRQRSCAGCWKIKNTGKYKITQRFRTSYSECYQAVTDTGDVYAYEFTPNPTPMFYRLPNQCW